ncbi:MAG: hypothetical protein ACOVNL_14380 [Prochlorococcaceae cyanobacterium]
MGSSGSPGPEREGSGRLERRDSLAERLLPASGQGAVAAAEPGRPRSLAAAQGGRAGA